MPRRRQKLLCAQLCFAVRTVRIGVRGSATPVVAQAAAAAATGLCPPTTRHIQHTAYTHYSLRRNDDSQAPACMTLVVSFHISLRRRYLLLGSPLPLRCRPPLLLLLTRQQSLAIMEEAAAASATATSDGKRNAAATIEVERKFLLPQVRPLICIARFLYH
eukprot:COSAG01_NODE_3963_length_5491_cov_83.216617_4_plen_161_part_00